MKDPGSLKQVLSELGPQYELVRELGRGTTAIVYLVRDQALGRDVALKVIRSSFGHDEEAVARLQREARLVAQLQHPNIVRLYGTLQTDEGNLVLLMEHVPGRNLKEVLREEGALSPRRALGYLRDVASALAYAHRRRIVHRDVKPENIYVDDEVGTARLADFGVARPWDRDTRLTLPGESLGTPAYMSPEQIDDEDVDGRSDVYSLGLVGYEMLSGQHPWEGENLFSVIYKQKNEILPPLSERVPGVPARLARVLERALRKEKEGRWASAEDFLAALNGLESGPERDILDEMEPLDRAFFGSDTTRDADAPDVGTRGVREEEERRIPDRADIEAALRSPEVETDDLDAAHPSDAVADSWVDTTDDGWGDVSAPPLEEEGGMAEHESAGGGRRSVAGALVLVLLASGVGITWWWSRGTEAPSAEVSQGVPASGETAVPQGPAGPAGPAGADPGGVPVLSMPAYVPSVGRAGEAVLLAVALNDSSGAPLQGRDVTFQVVDGGATLSTERATTGPGGVAQTEARLPEQPARVVLRASAEGASDPLELTVDVVPGAPADAAAFYGTDQSAPVGEDLPQVLGIRIRDRFGNPVPDEEVNFRIVSGGGRIGPARTTTDSAGRAYARWTLGTQLGTQLAQASVPAVNDLLVSVSATAQPLAVDTARVPEEVPAQDEPTPETEPPESPPLRVSPRSYAMGGTSVCRVAAGSVTCRGSDDRGQRDGGPSSGVVALAVGVSHACSLDAEGRASCWGANESGQLGDGTRTDRTEAVAVDTDVRFRTLAAGLAHTCGLDASGQPWCWGRNLGGQLGDGSRNDHAVPRPAGDVRLVSLVAGWNHTCGLDAEGRGWCWGLNSDGQLGDGTLVDRLSPKSLPGSPVFDDLTAGSAHTCGLVRGQVSCWGDDGFGQLGDGSTTDSDRPVPVPGLPGPVVRVVAGAVHTCALVRDGQAFCWGQNAHGQLGTGTTRNASSPVAVAGELRFQTILAGGGMTCGFAQGGGEYCWGLNQSGQLGDGTRSNRTEPTRVGG